jgi:hypothetical protein
MSKEPMSKEPYNTIFIDKNKMLPLKNELEKNKNDMDNQIKKDCETLMIAFNDVINNKLPSQKVKLLSNNIIKSSEFNLNAISTLREFDKYCGYNVNRIQEDLSIAIGVKTLITLEDYSYPPVCIYKLHVDIFKN